MPEHDDDIRTPTDFAATYSVTLSVAQDPAGAVSKDDDGWEHYAYTLRLIHRHGDHAHEIEVPWRQGLALTEPPELTDVLANLAWTMRDRELSWEEHAHEYGIDEDSRAAYALWEKGRDLARRLVEWCSSPDMVADFKKVQEV